MLNWFSKRAVGAKIDRDEIKARAENEVRELTKKADALDAAIEAVLRAHVKGKAQ